LITGSSSADHADPSQADHGVRCPTCGRRAPWRNNPERPFCCLTCRLVDLGVWLDEGYVVRGDPTDDVR
jgi:endogenous inhibitor of DNA gyrase (YacG/DUF329 family)